MKLTLEAINQAIAVLFFVCYAYQFVYIPVALLRSRLWICQGIKMQKK